MATTITTKDGTVIFYKNWGPRDAQTMFLLGHGHRVVAHDRRDHGRSSQTSIKLLRPGTLKTYKGLPYGMCATHLDIINADLLAFVKA
jgi:pimeloyl-ACP methyl ester carboxylesterase